MLNLGLSILVIMTAMPRKNTLLDGGMIIMVLMKGLVGFLGCSIMQHLLMIWGMTEKVISNARYAYPLRHAVERSAGIA